MAVSGKSQVFWLRYKPASDESIQRVVQLARDALPPMLGFYIVEHVRSGGRRVDILFCTKSGAYEDRIRNPDFWRRKRARGSVEDTGQCRYDECLNAFMHRWAQKMIANHCIHTTGSLVAVSRGLEDSRRTVRTRVRKHRRSR